MYVYDVLVPVVPRSTCMTSQVKAEHAMKRSHTNGDLTVLKASMFLPFFNCIFVYRTEIMETDVHCHFRFMQRKLGIRAYTLPQLKAERVFHEDFSMNSKCIDTMTSISSQVRLSQNSYK